ncbi:MAG: transcription elongation factor GreA [Candidatus Magasanikbacteria bacterium]|jgi:transcription elongation factor GreA
MQLPYRKPGKFSQMKQDNLMTQKKFDEIEKKLAHLKKILRPQAAEEVARLAETGDFSENAGYQNAKARLRTINHTILFLENKTTNASIIPAHKSTTTVEIGTEVTVLCDDNKTKKFLILGSSETNPGKGVISHNSPMGSSLIGHRVGDVVSVKLKTSTIDYKILQIQ